MPSREPPFNGAMRTAIEGTTAKGVNWANIFWSSPGPSLEPTPSQMLAYATMMYDNYATNIFAHLGKDAHMTQAVCNYYGNAGSQYTNAYVHSQAGGSSNDTEVDSLSACISWVISQTWRGGKPRTYLPALPSEAFQDSNTLASSFISTMESAAATFITTINDYASAPWGTGSNFVCISFFSKGVPRNPPVDFVIQSGTMHQRIDSMRRRLGREIT